MLEFRSGGRRVNQNDFFENLKRQAIEAAMKQLEDRVYGAAASIVDPETGKHAEVFIRRRDEANLILRTSGSPAFARELERRLDMSVGSIGTDSSDSADEEKKGVTVPRLYLAHASEDHDTVAKPLAEKMMAEGIEVWFDEWEIRAGDSLRRKMEEGLANCTHFLVLLTPQSLSKPWVQTEIDAGFVRAVGGESRFIGVRLGVSVENLSPFLRTVRCPEVRMDNAAEVAGLISDIYGVSLKPPRGLAPRYVQKIPDGLKAWSKTAVAVAEYLAHKSEHGVAFDPQLSVAAVAQELGLSEEDIRLGVLDLAEAGLVESRGSLGGMDLFWPKDAFFVEFDRYFFGFDSKADAVAIVAWLINQEADGTSVQDLAQQFSSWPIRRLNGALNFLDGAKLIHAIKALDSRPYTLTALHINDRTRRFMRENT